MSTGVDVYSTTPASNGTIGGTGYFAEGQAPSTVNDAARQVMADIAAWYGQAKLPQYLTGTAGTNTVTAGGPASMAAYAAGQAFFFIPAATNTAATTLNITPSGGAALGAKNIFYKGVACVGGEIVISQPVLVSYDGTQFNILGPDRVISATKQASTSGTSIDFTGAPAWAKKITIQFVGVSTSGTSNPLIQMGDSGGIETAGYLGAGSSIPNAAAITTTNFTTGFGFASASAAHVIHGAVVLTLVDATTFTWVASGTLGLSDAAETLTTAGSKSTSAALDRVRITTVGGADTFDAGSINVLYE